jgi:hypothetical protein
VSPTLGSCVKVQVALKNGELVTERKPGNAHEPNIGQEPLGVPLPVAGTFGFGGGPCAQPVASSTFRLDFGLFADPRSFWLPTCVIAQEPTQTAGIDHYFNAREMPPSTATVARREPALTVRFLPVKSGRKVVLVRVEEIDWIIAERNYVQLRVGQESHRVRGSLEAIELRLPPNEFVRISRSRIVQLSRVQELELLASRDCRLTLRDGTKMTLSRRYRPNFERLGIL